MSHFVNGFTSFPIAFFFIYLRLMSTSHGVNASLSSCASKVCGVYFHGEEQKTTSSLFAQRRY